MNRKSGRRPHEPAVSHEQLRWERLNCIKEGGYPLEQADAAELIGVSRESWCRWETGRAGMAEWYYRAWQAANEKYRRFTYEPDGSAKLFPLGKLVHPPGPWEMDYTKPISDRPLSPGTPVPKPEWPEDMTGPEIEALISEHRKRMGQREAAVDLPDAAELEGAAAPSET